MGRIRIGTKHALKPKNIFFRVVLLPGTILWILSKWIYDFFASKWPWQKFKFIYVNDDGTARELTKDEQDYLTEKFEPTDGGRPNIKFNYDDKTPDGKMRGFLLRRQLPPGIKVEANK